MKVTYPEIHSSDYIISLIDADYIIYNDKDKDFTFLEEEIDKVFNFI